MGYPITQNTSLAPLVFHMYDSSTHLLKAGLSPTVKLSKNGGAFATATGVVTEIGGGAYQVAANTIDSNTLGPMVLWATATGADDTQVDFLVVAYNGQSTALGLANVPSNLVQVNGLANYNGIAWSDLVLYAAAASLGETARIAPGSPTVNLFKPLDPSTAAHYATYTLDANGNRTNIVLT